MMNLRHRTGTIIFRFLSDMNEINHKNLNELKIY